MHACLRGVDHPNPQASQFSVLFCLCWGEKKKHASGLQFTPSLFLLSSTFCLSSLSLLSPFFLSHSLSSFSYSSFPLTFSSSPFLSPPLPSILSSWLILGPQSFKGTRVSLTKTSHLDSATDCTAGTRKVTRLLP